MRLLVVVVLLVAVVIAYRAVEQHNQQNHTQLHDLLGEGKGFRVAT